MVDHRRTRQSIALAGLVLVWSASVAFSKIQPPPPIRPVAVASATTVPAPTTVPALTASTTVPERSSAARARTATTTALLPIPEVPLSPAPGATSTAATSSSAEVARLRVAVTTNSDWTGIRFDAAVGGVRVVSAAPQVPIATRPDGFVVTWAPASGATVVVDLALERVPERTAVNVVVDKGWRGSTNVTLENRSATPFTVATVSNDRHTLDDANNTVRQSIAAETMFVATTQLRRTGEAPRVLAFYYPWFDTYSDGRLADRPSDPRNVQDLNGVTSMLTQARANGIDGFVASWAGAAHDGQELGVLLAAADRTGSAVSLYLETVSANLLRSAALPPDRNVVAQWLREGLDQAAANPAFLRDAAGVPVVFIYEMDRLPAGDWAAIVGGLGRPVRLVGDTTDRAYETVAWGVHRYNPNVEGGRAMSDTELATWDQTTAFEMRAAAATASDPRPRLFAATVSPGFDNRSNGGSTFVDRGANGEHYQSTWNAALGAIPEWILVTSWNEWYEGTSVEPSQRFGDLALRQTATNAAAWKAAR